MRELRSLSLFTLSETLQADEAIHIEDPDCRELPLLTHCLFPDVQSYWKE